MPRKRYEDWEARLGVTSFDPLDVMRLADAVKERATTVQLNRGNFVLVYQDDKVHYSPVEGFVPTGWVEIAKLEATGGI